MHVVGPCGADEVRKRGKVANRAANFVDLMKTYPRTNIWHRSLSSLGHSLGGFCVSSFCLSPMKPPPQRGYLHHYMGPISGKVKLKDHLPANYLLGSQVYLGSAETKGKAERQVVAVSKSTQFRRQRTLVDWTSGVAGKWMTGVRRKIFGGILPVSMSKVNLTGRIKWMCEKPNIKSWKETGENIRNCYSLFFVTSKDISF